MATKGSFEKATKNVKNAGFRKASQQLKTVNFAAEFAKRGVNIDSGLEK